MLTKFVYLRIFTTWLIFNPFGMVFGISSLTAAVLGARVIHPLQVGPKQSFDRELGEIEEHLRATDSNVTDIQSQRAQRLDENEKWRQQNAEILNKIASRFDSDEQDQRNYRERVIGDEKIVFGFILCISFLGGANFLRKHFSAKESSTITSFDSRVTSSTTSSPKKRSTRKR